MTSSEVKPVRVCLRCQAREEGEVVTGAEGEQVVGLAPRPGLSVAGEFRFTTRAHRCPDGGLGTWQFLGFDPAGES